MDELKLPECLLAVQEAIMNGYSQVIDLQIKQDTFSIRLREKPSIYNIFI